MDIRKCNAKGAQFGGLDSPCVQQSVQFLLARELPHPDCVLDHLAVSANPCLAVAPHDRTQIKVQRGGEAPVQPEFLTA